MRRISVLLVDDADDVRRLLRLSLRSHAGFEVVGEAGTAAEAADLAARHRPDVIVLDLGLPDLAGRDLLTQIRRTAPTSRIVIFSGSDTDRSWFERRSAGYVLKDAELDQLIAVLARAGTDQGHREATVDLPQSLTAVREARTLVRDLLEQWSLFDLSDDATLVVSELVSNAIEHAGSGCQLSIARVDEGVRIEVHDSGSGTPEPRPVSVTAEDGRGLLIIAALSAAWGIDDAAHGKTVWVELALPPS